MQVTAINIIISVKIKITRYIFTQGQKGLQNFCGIIGTNFHEYLYPRSFQERNPHVSNEGAELFFSDKPETVFHKMES